MNERPRAKTSKPRKKKPQPKSSDPFIRSRQAKEDYQRRTADFSNDVKNRRPAKYTKAEIAVRRRCRKSLRAFLLEMFPAAFPLQFSQDQEDLIAECERAVFVGLLKAEAQPRGGGKTTILVRAAIWAFVNGHRWFVVLIVATKDLIPPLLKAVLAELLSNPQLGKYYRTELLALRDIGKTPRGQSSQTWGGEPTGVELYSDRLCLGHIPIAKSVWGSVLRIVSLESSFRGLQFTTIDGIVRRPDLLLIDDPQSKKTAGSRTLTRKRLEIINGDILALSGPTTPLAAFAALTVIYAGDLADTLLDREQSPEWNGRKRKLVDRFPDREDLWETYIRIRKEDMRDGGGGEVATEFYRKNREAMDAGSKCSWKARILPPAISAIQTAYNIRMRVGEAAFMAEYQNEPLAQLEAIPYEISVLDVSTRTIDIPRGSILEDTERLTAFIDVQKKLLFFVVVAWNDAGRGFVTMYGSFPDQKRIHYSRRDAKVTLEKTFGEEFDASLYAGLDALTEYLLKREFHRPDGTTAQIDRIGIDAKWGWSTDIVRQVCSESVNRAKLLPSMGKYIGANSNQPWHQLPAVRAEKRGKHVRIIPPPKRGYRCRELRIDVNWWKSFVAERLTSTKGDKRAIVLHAGEHRMFAEHCAAEDPTIAITKTGDEVVEWRGNPGRPDNDFWDCLIGNAVIASSLGISLSTETSRKRTIAKNQARGNRPNRAKSTGRAKSMGRAK